MTNAHHFGARRLSGADSKVQISGQMFLRKPILRSADFFPRLVQKSLYFPLQNYLNALLSQIFLLHLGRDFFSQLFMSFSVLVWVILYISELYILKINFLSFVHSPIFHLNFFFFVKPRGICHECLHHSMRWCPGWFLCSHVYHFPRQIFTFLRTLLG